jgi:hypothetical protein
MSGDMKSLKISDNPFTPVNKSRANINDAFSDSNINKEEEHLKTFNDSA